MWLCAQETIVVGEVYDANTGEPLSNVNIYLQGTQLGTSTNNEGLFLLRKNLVRLRLYRRKRGAYRNTHS